MGAFRIGECLQVFCWWSRNGSPCVSRLPEGMRPSDQRHDVLHLHRPHLCAGEAERKPDNQFWIISGGPCFGCREEKRTLGGNSERDHQGRDRSVVSLIKAVSKVIRVKELKRYNYVKMVKALFEK